MHNLNLIIVGHNEELNLSKLFESLIFFNGIIDLNVFYCDQKSTDYSVKIAEKYGVNIRRHPMYGICETSRIRTVNENVKDGDWVLFLDADEEITKSLAKEIADIINSDKGDICLIPIVIHYMDIKMHPSFQPRMFKKGSIHLNNIPHHWYTFQSDKIIKIKNEMPNIDLKMHGHEIFNQLEKLNRYTDNEVENIKSISKIKLFYGMFIKPIIWFFGFGIWWGYFFKGKPGWILAYYNSAYEFFKWAKIYEKLYIK